MKRTPTDADLNTLDKLAETMIKLQQETGCDGIDFDWEHISEGVDSAVRAARLNGQYIVMKRLKDYFQVMNIDCEIGYTPRFNAYKAYGDHATGKEGYDMLHNANPKGLTLDEMPFDFVNLMTYDTPCHYLNWDGSCPSGNYFPFDLWVDFLESYQEVSSDPAVLAFLKKNTQIGFEPVNQMAGGVPPPNDVVDKVVAYVRENCYGGVFTWAINDGAENGEKGRASVAIHKLFASKPSGCSAEQTSEPTMKPTLNPTKVPTAGPTVVTQVPTGKPTEGTKVPTGKPTEGTKVPTAGPTETPASTQSPTLKPTSPATPTPTSKPTSACAWVYIPESPWMANDDWCAATCAATPNNPACQGTNTSPPQPCGYVCVGSEEVETTEAVTTEEAQTTEVVTETPATTEVVISTTEVSSTGEPECEWVHVTISPWSATDAYCEANCSAHPTLPVCQGVLVNPIQPCGCQHHVEAYILEHGDAFNSVEDTNVQTNPEVQSKGGFNIVILIIALSSLVVIGAVFYFCKSTKPDVVEWDEEDCKKPRTGSETFVESRGTITPRAFGEASE